MQRHNIRELCGDYCIVNGYSFLLLIRFLLGLFDFLNAFLQRLLHIINMFSA